MNNEIAPESSDAENTKFNLILVQVCYASVSKQFLRDFHVAIGTTIEQLIAQSGVLDFAPEIKLSECKVGIYSHVKPLETILRENDRVEIYRPLIADPKESRRRRADKKENAKTS